MLKPNGAIAGTGSPSVTMRARSSSFLAIALTTAPQQHAVSGCISAETGLLGCTATALMEATVSTTARFPGSTRDI
jgi:hypothetical protein